MVMQKYDKRKVTSCLFIKRLLIRHASRDTYCPCLGDADRVRLRESVNSPQEKAFYPLFLLHMQAQKKKLSKRKRRKKISRSAERNHRCRWTTPPFKKGGRKLLCGGRKLYSAQKISEKKSRGAAFISCAEPRAHHHSYSHSGEAPPPLFVCFSVRRKSPCRPSFLFSRRNTAENLSRHFREHHG